MIEFKVERLEIVDFARFYRFAKDFVLDRYLDYPAAVRRKYLETDLERKQLRKAVKKKETVGLTAVLKGKVIGFAVLNFQRGGAVHIQWLAVDQKYRDQGVGSQILKEVEVVAKERKCHFMILWTESRKNIDFYQKRGYCLVGLQRESWYGMDEYLMQKNISKPFPIEKE